MMTCRLSQWPLDRNDQEPLDRPKPPARHQARAVQLTEQGSISPECFGKEYWLFWAFFFSPRPPIDSSAANHCGISALGVQVKVTHPLKIHQRSSDLGVQLCCSAILLPRHSQKFSYTSPFVWRSERNLWVRWFIPVLSSVLSSVVFFFFLARHNLMENF